MTHDPSDSSLVPPQRERLGPGPRPDSGSMLAELVAARFDAELPPGAAADVAVEAEMAGDDVLRLDLVVDRLTIPFDAERLRAEAELEATQAPGATDQAQPEPLGRLRARAGRASVSVREAAIGTIPLEVDVVAHDVPFEWCDEADGDVSVDPTVAVLPADPPAGATVDAVTSRDGLIRGLREVVDLLLREAGMKLVALDLDLDAPDASTVRVAVRARIRKWFLTAGASASGLVTITGDPGVVTVSDVRVRSANPLLGAVLIGLRRAVREELEGSFPLDAGLPPALPLRAVRWSIDDRIRFRAWFGSETPDDGSPAR